MAGCADSARLKQRNRRINLAPSGGIHSAVQKGEAPLQETAARELSSMHCGYVLTKDSGHFSNAMPL